MTTLTEARCWTPQYLLGPNGPRSGDGPKGPTFAPPAAVEVVDHNTTPASFNGPALTYSVDGPNVFGVAMAWTGFDGRVNVQRLAGSQAPDGVTMLADVAIDRPALVVHKERLHLAFASP